MWDLPWVSQCCRKQCCREIEAYLCVTPWALCAAVNKDNTTPSCKKVGNSIRIIQLLLLCTTLVGKALGCCLYFQRIKDTCIFKELQKWAKKSATEINLVLDIQEGKSVSWVLFRVQHSEREKAVICPSSLRSIKSLLCSSLTLGMSPGRRHWQLCVSLCCNKTIHQGSGCTAGHWQESGRMTPCQLHFIF